MDTREDLTEHIIDQLESDQEYCHCQICEYQLVGSFTQPREFYRFVAKYKTKKLGFANTKCHISVSKGEVVFNLTNHKFKGCDEFFDGAAHIIDGKIRWAINSRYIDDDLVFFKMPKKKINEKSYIDTFGEYHVLLVDKGWYYITMAKNKKDTLFKNELLEETNGKELNKETLEKILMIPLTDLQSDRLLRRIEKLRLETIPRENKF